ncbi:MAG: M48 family metallopeptidase, partial [Firmicutes bacterium]|nr:M48 family metallopeptidase [Bacillota bacterium]
MKWMIVWLLVGVFVFETVVSLCNRKHSLRPIPDCVRDVYDEERYQKWLAYSLEVQRFSLVQRGLQLIIMIVFLFGTFARLEQLVASWTSNPILQSLYFLGVYMTIMLLLGIPLQIYRTFSIEERHGFNRTTPQTFVKDLLLSYLVTMALGGLLIGVINALYLRFAGNLWLFVALTWGIIAAIMLLAVAFLGKIILRLFNKFEPLPEGSLRTRIEELASSLGFNVAAILVMDASKRSARSNAMFSGIGKTKEVVLFDTLLETMSDDEVLAVLGHELGHAVHKDTWRLLGQQIVVAALYSIGIGLVLQNQNLYTA